MARLVEPDEVAVTDRPAPPPAFEAFFSAEYARLARALYLVTGDAAEAEDVAQEAMVRMYERWDRVSRADSPTAYLYRAAMNLHRSRMRRLKVRARRLLPGGPPAAPVPDPAEAAEVRDEIDRALDALPASQREAVVLVEWLGLSTEEAGRALGITPIAVRVRLSRARATVQQAIGGDDGE
jgi:RNA polymerase sigma-70 factor (ECF subfamily)